MHLNRTKLAVLFSSVVTTLALSACQTQIVGGSTTDTGPGVGGASGGGVGGTSGVGVGGHASGGSYVASSSSGAPLAIPLCNRTGVDPGPADAYEHMKYGMAATWLGTATVPAGGIPSDWSVDFSFTPDGRYSAHCLGAPMGEVCSALNVGSDVDVPGKTWMLDDIQASGLGLGQLQIYFSGSGTWNRGDLEHISVSDDLTELKFEFWHKGYGPILYDLHCKTQ